MANNLRPPRKTKKDARALDKTAKKLIQMAKEGSAEQNFFFQTTFDKYQTQLQIMDDLQKRMERTKEKLSDDTLSLEDTIVHEKRLMSLSCEYNKTSTASNNTVQTLLKIIAMFSEGQVMAGGEEEGFDL